MHTFFPAPFLCLPFLLLLFRFFPVCTSFNENSHHVESLFRYEIETQDKRMGHESSPSAIPREHFFPCECTSTQTHTQEDEREKKLLRKICIKDFSFNQYSTCALQSVESE